MRWPSVIRLRLRSLFSREGVEQELDEELRYHLEREVDEGIAAGMAPEDARYAALQSIRDIEQRKEECRDMRGLNLAETAVRDMRYALRSLRREPEFTFAGIASLALAIGMATSVFIAVDSVLLRPLNLPEPDRLALIWGVEPDGDTRSVVSFADFEDWRRDSHAFDAAATYNSYYKPVLTGGSRPERLTELRVSHGYFDVLKAHPALGRFFFPEEDFDGRDDVVVLSYPFWRDRFQSNTGIVGQRILLDGRPETVVGVASRDLKTLPQSLGGQAPQIYRPVGEERGEKSRDGRHLQAIVRLKAGVTIGQAQAELNVLCRRMKRLRRIPGIGEAALVAPLPMSGDFDRTLIEIPGEPIAAGERDSPDRYVVTPDYFALVKIPLLQGRLFNESDNADHRNVALINQTAARVFWPGESPIGKRFRAGSASGDFDHWPYREIVGVVGDVAQNGLGLPPRPQIYMPHAQYADRFVTLLVRAKNSDPLTLAEPLRRAVLTADAEQPIYDVIPFQSLVDGSIAAGRFAIWILGAFALGALLLAATGIYGIVSYTVAQRAREFGIRMALGASPLNVLQESLTTGVSMIMPRVILGVGGAFAARTFLSSFLFGAGSIDLASFAGVPLGMIIVAVAACYLPARRAAKADPLRALRQE
jgi:hypothetical protein